MTNERDRHRRDVRDGTVDIRDDVVELDGRRVGATPGQSARARRAALVSATATLAPPDVADDRADPSRLAPGALASYEPAQRVAILLEETAPTRPGAPPPWWVWDALLGALTTVTGIDITDVVPTDDERAAAWVELLAAVRTFTSDLPYVGSYKSALLDAARVGARLKNNDRRIAARLILDAAAGSAATWADFVEGVRTAGRLDPRLLEPTGVVRVIVNTGFDNVNGRAGIKTLAWSVRVALEVIAASDADCLTSVDVTALAAAIEMLPSEAIEQLRSVAEGLSAHDRTIVRRLLQGNPVPVARH